MQFLQDVGDDDGNVALVDVEVDIEVDVEVDVEVNVEVDVETGGDSPFTN